jgi:hypothetical protein
MDPVENRPNFYLAAAPFPLAPRRVRHQLPSRRYPALTQPAILALSQPKKLIARLRLNAWYKHREKPSTQRAGSELALLSSDFQRAARGLKTSTGTGLPVGGLR